MADNFGSDYITIVDEDGEEFELEVLMTMEYNGATYQAVIPAVDAGEEVDLEVSILKNVEEDGEIISRKTIEDSIDGGVAYRIREDGRIVGGLVLTIDKETQHNHLDLLFVTPDAHSKGIGYAAWQEVERLYPETLVWETCTPYFETRNIHFYVNKCGFHIVEFFNSHHPDPHDPETGEENNYEGEDFDGMFRFEKRMK